MIDEQERQRLIRETMEESKIPLSLATELVDIGMGLSTGDLIIVEEDPESLARERQRVAAYLGMKSAKPAE